MKLTDIDGDNDMDLVYGSRSAAFNDVDYKALKDERADLVEQLGVDPTNTTGRQDC